MWALTCLPAFNVSSNSFLDHESMLCKFVTFLIFKNSFFLLFARFYSTDNLICLTLIISLGLYIYYIEDRRCIYPLLLREKVSCFEKRPFISPFLQFLRLQINMVRTDVTWALDTQYTHKYSNYGILHIFLSHPCVFLFIPVLMNL